MIASVSLAGMICRRADAGPDTMQSYMQTHVRFALTRRAILITTHARPMQCLRNASQKNSAEITRENMVKTCQRKLRLWRNKLPSHPSKKRLAGFC
jgi:hypothetical protein